MENAAKALLIAAGILIGLILITMIIYGYNQISDYYIAKEENKEREQLDDFNKQYSPYNREDVRGSDIISLVNKIIDFNTINSDEEPMRISIEIPNNDKAKLFYYNYSQNKAISLIPLGTTYTQDNINTKLLRVANTIEGKYTQAMATKLAANMSTLMGENSRRTKAELLKELKIEYEVNNEEILKYYQYLQFKRAHFDCEELAYNDGRITSFRFTFNGTFE